MFGALMRARMDKDDANSEEGETFLPKANTGADNTKAHQPWTQHLWKASTVFFAAMFLASVVFSRYHAEGTYENGFNTDLEPAIPSIRMHRMRFDGGIIVNESSLFELVLDQEGPRYTGRPSQKLDDAWDRLVGGYVALSKIEAETIHGDVSVDGGSYFVVPHVRHSLHCVNYLRKVAYEKWYPTIRHEDKPTVPTFWQHVDHCIEILRQTVQCHSDLTPVPHIWSEGKGMYLADTGLEHTCRDYESIMEWQDRREESSKSKQGHQ